MNADGLATFAPHALALLTLGLALLLIARLMSQKLQPGNTLAWLLLIGLVPYLGIPLYLVFGGRKLRRLARRKVRLTPPPQGGTSSHAWATPSLPATFRPQFDGAFPTSADHHVEFLETGEEAFATLLRSIARARSSIDVMTFILARDETGRAIVDALTRRAREGIRVRLLLDALGCLWSSRRFVDPLRNAGGLVETFMPVLPIQTRGSANLRNHRKIALFDGHSAIVGGHNLAHEYLGPAPDPGRWLDFGALLQGGAVAHLQSIFNDDWQFATGGPAQPHPQGPPPRSPPPAGSAELQVMASGPDVQDDTLYESILSLIQEVDERLWIVTPYFVPDEVLFRSLMVKARTGREIRLVVPARSNHRIADLARRHFLRELSRAGVEVLLFGPGMLHAKALLADDRVGLFGSVNLDSRSLLVNYEVGVFVHSAPEVAAMRRWASRIMGQCRPLSETERTDPRRLPALAEDLARLFAPLL